MLLAAAAGIGVAGWSQEAQPRLGFETGPENLTALVVQGTELKPDPEAEVSVTREAGEFKEGMGALCYRFPVRPGPLRVLAGPVRLGSDTASVRLWARSSHPASLLFQLRERDGSTYQLAFSLPAQRWSEVRVNLNEFLPD
ncbi:MAG: hypothetical protein FJ315_06185, partial [SAR202 cluster bacterium]|nr:hypothetical protein [SAR202 cluster bacterium]